MRVARRDGERRDRARRRPLVNFCKPAVDPLFASAAAVWGDRNLAVVLTGMGSDGLRGAARDRRGRRQRASRRTKRRSVVWGMPGSVAHAGLCSAVLPLDQIAPRIARLFARRPVVTPLDYDYLRKLLKERSGLVLSADKQYLVESRLLPVARGAGLAGLGRTGAEAQRAAGASR